MGFALGRCWWSRSSLVDWATSRGWVVPVPQALWKGHCDSAAMGVLGGCAAAVLVGGGSMRNGGLGYLRDQGLRRGQSGQVPQ